MDWNWIQGTGSQSGSGTSFSQNFTGTVTPGDIVVGGILFPSGSSIVSIKDDVGNVYGVTVNAIGNGNILAGFSSGARLFNSPDVITVTLTPSAGFIWLIIDAFSFPDGAAGSVVADGSANAPGTSNNILTTGNFTTTGSDDLVYSVIATSGTATTGAGFNPGNGSGTGLCSEWKVLNAPSTTANGTFATNTGDGWLIAFASNAPVPVTGGVSLAACEW